MKIAFFIQDISTQGGTERTTIALASQMAKNGHEVTIVSGFKSGGNFCYSCDNRVKINFLTDWNYSLSLSMFARMMMVLRLIPLLKKSDDIKSAEVIISQKFLASVVVFLSRLSGKTFACEHYRYKMYNRFVRFVRSSIYKHFRALVVLSQNDADRFHADGVRRVEVVENMVSVEPIAYQGLDSKRIISVGRLTYQKGYDMFIDALALIKDALCGWKVDIFGEGEDREMLQNKIEKYDLQETVFLKGFTENIVSEYSQSALYVMSSRFEGFPMVLLEALASSLPVVAFDCPEGPRQILSAGGGVIVEKQNVSALAGVIANMLNDNELRCKLSAQAPIVASNYAPQKIYDKWMLLMTK